MSQRLFLFFVVISLWSSSATALEGFPTDQNLNLTIAKFQEWFEANYDGHPKVRLAEAGEGMRMGVFASETIAAESLYLSIPYKIIIGEDTIFPTPVIGPALRRQQRNLVGNPHQVTLALFLIHERFVAKEKSFFNRYISLIPTEHDTPEFYSSSDLDVLQGTHIREKVHAAREQRRREFDQLKRHVFTQEQRVFTPDVFTFKNWQWAMGICNTRMIWWDGKPHLVPMLDMINCRQGPKNTAQRVHQTQGVGRKANTHAPWRFEKGEQVFENYGQPNPTYFFYHGFVMLPNVHDCATFRPSRKLFRSALNDQGIRRQKLEQFRLFHNDYCITPAKYDDVLAVARIAAATDNEVKSLHQQPAAPRGGNRGGGKMLSVTTERRALKLFGESIKEQLARYPQHVAGQREEIQNDMNVPFRYRMSVLFRETQREMLTGTLETLRGLREKLPKKKKQNRDKNTTTEADAKTEL